LEPEELMNHTVLTLILAANVVAASAQTTAKPVAPGAAASGPAVHHTAATTATAAKLPPGVPVIRGLVKTAFTLRYEDYKIGTGADAEPGKLYKVFYTGYLGSNGKPEDGHEFDSSNDHRQPLKDKDGQPVMGDDGKPKMDEPQPMAFPQGMGRLIPGFDQGFAGMKIGGKRRLFIPWQLAYGAKGRPGPDAEHPGIPPKSDLIFDVELVDVAELPAPQGRPGMPGGMGGRPMPPGGIPHPTPQGAPGTPGAPPPSGKPADPTAPTTAPGSAPATPAPSTTPPPSAPPTTAPPPTTPATPPASPAPTSPSQR
jgi:peptidylprolyl isomerase